MNAKERLIKAFLLIISVTGMILLGCAFLPSRGFAQDSTSRDGLYSDGLYAEDLVLAVRTGNYVLSQGMLALQHRGRYYLPLVGLAELLDFYVEPDYARLYVEGWYLEPANSFVIDGEKRELVHKEKRQTLPEEAFFADSENYPDEIYIALETLNDLLPVELHVDLSALVLHIKAEEDLPFQQRLKRQARHKRFLAKKAAGEDDRNYPFVPNPYRLLGKPVLDLQLQSGYDGRTDAPQARTALSGVQDFLYTSADYSVSLGHDNGQFQRPDNIRLRLRRQNLGGGELPLGLEDAQAGDVRLINRDLIDNGISGRGAVFTTESARQSAQFDQITIEGTGVPGWETELYRNNELLDFGVVDERGEYRFEDVTLTYGNNRIRVLLYGPQGQVREVTESYVFGQNMVPAGETEFRFGVMDGRRDLIPIEGRRTGQPKGFAGNFTGFYGLSERVSLFGSLSSVPTARGHRHYLSGGAMLSALNSLTQAELYKQTDGGGALDLRFITDFFGVKSNLRASVFHDFESPEAGFAGQAKTFEAEAELRRNFATPLGLIGLDFDGTHRIHKDAPSTTTLMLRESFSRSGTRITHQTSTSLRDGKHNRSTGRLSATIRMRDWRLRSGFNYTLYPEFDAESVMGEIRYQHADEYSTAFRLQRNLNTADIIANLQFTKDFRKFLGSVETEWSRQDGFSLLFRTSTAIGPYGRDGAYTADSRPMTGAAPVRARIYHDTDYDGQFGEGDIPLEGAKLQLGRRASKEQTGSDGMLRTLSPHVTQPVDVSVLQRTIDDPYLRPAVPGYAILPRPGTVPMVDLPLIETGAIDGTLTYAGSDRPVQGMTLELVDVHGVVAAATVTAYDGFYTFEQIAPGDYIIRADPEYGVDVPPLPVSVSPEDLFLSGEDLELTDADILAPLPAMADAAAHDKQSGQGDDQSRLPAPSSRNGKSLSTVRRVRIGEHPDKVRMVLDLTSAPQYSTKVTGAGDEISIDLKDTAWDALRHWRGHSTPVLKAYETRQLEGGGTRLILRTGGPAEIALIGVLPPEGNKGYRLFIDVRRK